MAKKDKKAVEIHLGKLIDDRLRLARAYVLMVYSGGRVNTVRSADEFCARLAEAREQVAAADKAVGEHYELGYRHGFLTEPLAEYIRRVGEKMVAVV